jgi:hypothetical protein
MDYLLKMKSMDEEILKRKKGNNTAAKLEMTDVVPIGGLVMAQLHVAECELQTAIELWSPKPTNAPPKKPPRSAVRLRPLRTSLNFQEFTGKIELKSFSLDEPSEFTDFVMETCPSLTSQYCVDVMLRLSGSKKIKENENQEDKEPKPQKKLGNFLTKAEIEMDQIDNFFSSSSMEERFEMWKRGGKNNEDIRSMTTLT